jgi:O-Antigen ligase
MHTFEPHREKMCLGLEVISFRRVAMKKSIKEDNIFLTNGISDKKIVWAMCCSALSITLLILPKSNYDPVSLPKFSFLIVTTWSIFLYCFYRNILPSRRFFLSFFGMSLIVFKSLLLINLIFNNYAFEERIFGVSGRNTGVILYFTLAIVAILFAQISPSVSLTYLATSITLANIGVCLYFLIQLSGNDVFRYTTYYPAPSSTLGNPNFVSGFVGFASIAVWMLIVNGRSKFRYVFVLVSTSVSLFVVIKSQSIQGIFAFGGSVVIFALIVLKRRSIKLFALGVFFVFLAMIIGLLGLIGSGPLSSRLASTTLFSRFDYWRAAIAMTMDSPFVGKGIDSFGDYYREFRDEAALNRFGESQVADSAHNLFLDFFSNGGVPLGLTYIFIQAIPAFLLTRKILNSEKLDLQEALLISIWTGFTLQSLVSVNQVGVGIWGWVLAGILYSRVGTQESSLRVRDNLAPRIKASLLTLFIPLIIFVSITPLRSDAQFLAAANSADGLKLKAVALNWPLDSKRILLTSAGFSAAGYDQIALDVSLVGVAHNARSYLLWKQIYDNKKTSVDLRMDAERVLKSLEPRFVQTP